MKKLDNSREKFMHVNVDNASFQMEFDDEYVDKSDLISLTNKFINKSRRFMCVTRPRRFGKSVTVKMLNAYYSKANDTKNLFVNLKIGQDPNFENYLNKYHVLYIDMQDFDLSIDNEGIGFIDRIHKDLIKTLKNKEIIFFI